MPVIHNVVTYTESGISVESFLHPKAANKYLEQQYLEIGQFDGFYSIEIVSTTLRTESAQ